MPVEHIVKETLSINQEGARKPTVFLQENQDDPWLSQSDMVTLFNSKRIEIIKAVKAAYDVYQFDKKQTIRRIQHIENTGQNASAKTTVQYKFEVVIAIGLMLNGDKATQFQQWAMQILKDYLIRGASINKPRLESRDKWRALFLKAAKRLEEK